MNDFRIARNDDETFTDEDTFVSERRDALVAERRKDIESVRDALTDLIGGDGDGYFDTKLAEFVISYEKAHKRGDSEGAISGELLASFNLHRAIEHLITDRLTRDAETDAQAEWDSRQTGAPE